MPLNRFYTHINYSHTSHFSSLSLSLTISSPFSFYQQLSSVFPLKKNMGYFSTKFPRRCQYRRTVGRSYAHTLHSASEFLRFVVSILTSFHVGQLSGSLGKQAARLVPWKPHHPACSAYSSCRTRLNAKL